MGTFIDFEYVKAHADFEAVLGFYDIQARGSGDQRRVLCPFHDDEKPSLSIHLRDKKFQCFGCQASGNILEFVAMMEDTDDLRAAATQLGSICSIALSERTARTSGTWNKGKKRPSQRAADEGQVPPARVKPIRLIHGPAATITAPNSAANNSER